MTSLISAVGWIPRGAAAQHPSKYTVDEAELERVSQLARVRLEDAQMELELARAEEGDGMGDEGDEGAEQDEEWEE
jgi:periodic tryptophan protein 1